MGNEILKAPEGPPSDVERIKKESDYLRGTLKESMLEPLSAGISDDDNRLMKHHGSYLQDDRDLRNERQKQKLEPAYQFMLRVRMPGGVATPEQWLVMDEPCPEIRKRNIEADNSGNIPNARHFKMEHEKNDSVDPFSHARYHCSMRRC